MRFTRTTLATSAALIGLALIVTVPASADQQILDDLIVDGSACIGLDCVNGESFGFDTLRLKENNLRIRAFDTSTSASFPTRDWQITFNETTNGGAEKFSIDDIDGGRTPFTITAGAPSHSLFVSSAGRLGLGTNTPVVNLHIKTGNTPTLRLEQDGSQGFTSQIWDVAANETNFFIRDASNGSKLPFRIRPVAPTNSLYIKEDGDVGFGTNNPTEKLHSVVDNASVESALLLQNLQGPVRVEFREGAGAGSSWLNSNFGGQFLISRTGTGGNEVTIRDRDITGATNTMTVAGDIEAVDFNMSSSREWKSDIVPVEPAEYLAKVGALEIAEWRFTSDSSGIRHVGPMAEDFASIFGLGSDDKHLSGVDVQGVALAAIKGLNEKLDNENAALKAELAQLRQMVETLVGEQ